MNVLVTGGAGFIGSHLVEELVKKDYKVKVVDNLSTGKLSNLIKVQDQLNFKNLNIVTDDLDKEFYSIDTVYHLAALADIVPSIERPYEYVNVNVMGTMRVMEAARKAGVKRVVYAASSSCYGIPNNFPTSEESEIDVRYPYALSKYLGEQLFLHWVRVYGISGVSLRLFNVYGPRARSSGSYGAVLGVFLGQKKSGMPITIVGDGTQKRDFTYVSDVAKAFVLAGESTLNLDVLNIGTSNPVSVNYLAQLIGDSDKVYIPKRPGEPDLTHALITKAKSKLGWVPEVSIEDGMSKVLRDSASWGDAPAWTSKQIEEFTRDWFRYLGKESDH